MSVSQRRQDILHESDSEPATAELRLPADCPLAQCSAITNGRSEIKRLKRAERELRQALVREKLLLQQKNELILQKELLHRESDHRLLNGLQMVASLLSTQSRLSNDAEVSAQLKIAADRVVTISKVHRSLHLLDQLESVALKEYLENLCRDMSGMLPNDGRERTLTVEGISVNVPTAAGIPLGFIVSELVINSAKYANGKIIVCLARHNGKGYALSVCDDGPGLPEGFDPKKTKGLGMKIISSLVSEIGGELLFGRGDAGQGARFTVLFSGGRNGT